MRAVTSDLKVRSTMLLPARTVVLMVDRQRQTAGTLSFIVLYYCVPRIFRCSGFVHRKVLELDGKGGWPQGREGE